MGSKRTMSMSMVNTPTATTGKMPGKTVTMKAALAIPKPKGAMTPGKSITSKVTPPKAAKMPLGKAMAAKGLAKQDPHQTGPKGHMSYLAGKSKSPW